MRRAYGLLLFIFISIFLASVVFIACEVTERKRNIDAFDDLYALVSEAPLASLPSEEEDIEAYAQEEAERPEINLDLLTEANPDCIGWLYVKGTNINYPVMHTPDSPEEYIRKSFYGKSSSSGTPFLDARCNLESDNLIIYGHNMFNGTMFAHLKKYLEKSFFNDNPIITFYTEEGIYDYNICAVLLLKNDDVWYSFTEGESSPFVENVFKRRLYDTKVIVKEGDSFITLSTCYGKKDEDRLIVIGVRENGPL